MIAIYTTKGCPWCKMTKEFFKENNIKYKEIDVDNNKKAVQEMIKKSGQMSVPVIGVNGKIIIGFDEQKLSEALKL